MFDNKYGALCERYTVGILIFFKCKDVTKYVNYEISSGGFMNKCKIFGLDRSKRHPSTDNSSKFTYKPNLIAESILFLQNS